MNLDTALLEIRTFWNSNEPFPFGESDNNDHVERLQNEFSFSLPDILQDYIRNVAPLEDFYFNTVGNPVRIYGVGNLKFQQDGYNYNPLKKQVIHDWENNLFIFADEGADPIIIDLQQNNSGIQKLMHGTGNWKNGETIANTIGQFLLCCAAQHHALNDFAEDPIIDDDEGFNLADNAAKWYFTNMKKWAGDYYGVWCSVFDNH